MPSQSIYVALLVGGFKGTGGAITNKTTLPVFAEHITARATLLIRPGNGIAKSGGEVSLIA